MEVTGVELEREIKDGDENLSECTLRVQEVNGSVGEEDQEW